MIFQYGLEPVLIQRIVIGFKAILEIVLQKSENNILRFFKLLQMCDGVKIINNSKQRKEQKTVRQYCSKENFMPIFLSKKLNLTVKR